MSDLHNELRDTIQQLNTELDEIEQLDPEVRGLLQQTVEEIQETLAQAEAEDQPGEPDESVVTRLKETADEFEADHPTLSGIIGSIIDTLSRMGI